MLLALDTSTRFVSVAVYDEESDAVLGEGNEVGPMLHGELLAPTIRTVLAGARLRVQDLTALVVGVGPGPYTGLRVGIATARVLALTASLPVYGICSLDALAVAVATSLADEGGFVVTSDARRKELFWAAYDAEARRTSGPFVDRPADMDFDGRPVAGVGPSLYPDHFPPAPGPAYPHAADLARLLAGEHAELLDAEPIYLRRPDAVAPGPVKRVS